MNANGAAICALWITIFLERNRYFYQQKCLGKKPRNNKQLVKDLLKFQNKNGGDGGLNRMVRNMQLNSVEFQKQVIDTLDKLKMFDAGDDDHMPDITFFLTNMYCYGSQEIATYIANNYLKNFTLKCYAKCWLCPL